MKNTVPGLTLENVVMKMKTSDGASLVPLFAIPALSIPFSECGTTYVVFSKHGTPFASFSNTLQFKVKENEDEGGDVYDDEYVVEDVDVVCGDYMRATWFVFENVFGGEEVCETYALTNVGNIKGVLFI